ncbi:GABA-B-R3 [Trypoxylus dichotomus]
MSLRKHLYALVTSIALVATLMASRKSLKSLLIGTDVVLNVNESVAHLGYLGDIEERIRNYDNYMPVVRESVDKIEGGKVVIYFLGLFEFSTVNGKRAEGFSEAKAAELAVKHVNEKNILPGYILKLLINDTECDPGVAIDRFFHALYSNKTISMLLGSGCSNVSESLAHMAIYWNILQVSYGSTSPILSDRNKFPLFFRTAAPESSKNPARIAFLKHFKWNTVATFSQSENEYLMPSNNLITILEKVNITCSATVTFALENFKEQLNFLKTLDTRIIIASFSEEVAAKIFCEVYYMDMYGTDYVWILNEPNYIWWDHYFDCDGSILKKVMESFIIIGDYNVMAKNETSPSGLDDGGFLNLLNLTENVSKYARHTYDAIWAMALSLRKVQYFYFRGILEQFTYRRRDMAEDFLFAMDSLKFNGVSGPIRFSGADRVGNSVFRQIQNGKLETVAIYFANRNFLEFNCDTCKSIKWKEDRVPIAQRVFKTRLVTIPRPVFYSILLISLLGITICLTFLYLNLHFRRNKSFKLSSPKLNNVAVIGCIFVYLAVILLGVDKGSLLKDEDFSRLCNIKVYLLSAGFSLAFGSMFAKTYRVHRIFTYSASGLVKDKILKDEQLIALILLLLFIDAVIISFWIFVDPLQKRLHNLTAEISSEDRGVVYQPQVEVCACNNTRGWFFAIYGYKGFLLIMGVYMAWETRNVKIQALNDSQYIGICVYSAISSAVVVLLSNFLSQNTIISYIATTSSILISTSITLFLLFLPKLRAVLGDEKEDPVMESMGLKLESNTKRMVIDDPRESSHRVEIQNKVYKSEIEILDREIERLENLLLKYGNLKESLNGNGPFTITDKEDYHSVKLVPSWDCKKVGLISPDEYKKKKLFLSDIALHKCSILGLDNTIDKFRNFVGSIPTFWFSLQNCNKSPDISEKNSLLLLNQNRLEVKSTISVVE